MLEYGYKKECFHMTSAAFAESKDRLNTISLAQLEFSSHPVF